MRTRFGTQVCHHITDMWDPLDRWTHLSPTQRNREWASFVAARCNRTHLWHGPWWPVASWPRVQAAAAVTSRGRRAQTAADRGEGQREYPHVRPHPWVHSDLPEVVHDGLATHGRSREGDARRCLLGAAVSTGEGDARGSSGYACMHGWWQLSQEQPVGKKGRVVLAATAGARAREPAMAALTAGALGSGKRERASRRGSGVKELGMRPHRVRRRLAYGRAPLMRGARVRGMVTACPC
jgi:hypothetical protein